MFAEYLADARQLLHENLSLTATYRAPGVDSLTVETAVRLIRDVTALGDLDRQGFAKVAEDINKVVFDTVDVPTPERGGRVTIEGHGTFRVDDVDPADGRYRTCPVIRERV